MASRQKTRKHESPNPSQKWREVRCDEEPSVENKAKFYTYALPSEKTISLIVRGLDHTYTAQEILEDLFPQGIFNIKTAKPFVTTKAK